MICTCPKCNTPTECAPVEIPSESSFNTCSSCRANFVVRKESFAKRALFTGNAIFCAECGEHPGSTIYCQNCHAIYPDFHITETSSAAKRRIDKIISSLNALKKLNIGKAPQSDHVRIETAPLKAGKAKGPIAPGHPAFLAVVLAILIFILAGGGYYWYQNKGETAYAENYVRALLGIKTARDLELRIGNRLISDMRKGSAATLTAAEQKSSTTAKTSVDNLMRGLGKMPDKFSGSDAALKQLNAAYGNLHVTVATPAGASDIFAAAIKTSDDEFLKNAGTLKSGLPKKIAVILAESRKKYKPLEDF